MKFSKALSLAGLLATAAIGVYAAPMEDISVTSVDLSEAPTGQGSNEHLYVTVSRTDDLVDDDGAIVAERVMAVQVTFDVIENQLHCNGVPVEIGVNNIQVEAQIAANPEKLTVASEEDASLLADSFDVGLATVEVTASIVDEMKTEDGMTFRRIDVQEKIVEINGEEVVQTEVGQQILDVFEDGAVRKWYPDPLSGFLLPGPAITSEEPAQEIYVDKQATPLLAADHAGSKGCASALVDPIVDWWNSQTAVVQGLITGGFVAGVFALALAMRNMIMGSFQPDYMAVPVAERSQDDEQIWNEDKKQDEEKRPFLS
ncbi:hypothetical protein VTP01DRAFT_7778 [Rhizomucor pusillus]|uniref:uncharacterized protein n=1 Tax=Rhizomucor pusillus TaxID=4840 RepID=UPI003743B9E2